MNLKCKNKISIHQELAEDMGLTEWDVQLENGILPMLDTTYHTSYNFFPSSAIKKDVPIKFYQRP